MSDHHGPNFDYQPALPISNGKTFMWLFLSTEIMFFAALIGTYIVLRFGAIAWPSTHDVHLVEFMGFINTFILICSSVTIVLSSGRSQEEQRFHCQSVDVSHPGVGHRVFGSKSS